MRFCRGAVKFLGLYLPPEGKFENSTNIILTGKSCNLCMEINQKGVAEDKLCKWKIGEVFSSSHAMTNNPHL